MAGEPQRGRLIVLSAPSGAGKTTLVRALLARQPNLRFSISYTTRPKRANETDGSDYFFVDVPSFDAMLERQEFLEHARVFDHWYGTRQADVEALLERGINVLLEIDWQGAEQVRAKVPDAITVFVLPPSLAELERRLRARATDSDPVVARRLADALEDMRHWREFGYTLVNDDLEAAATALASVVAGRGAAWRSDSPAVVERAERILAAEASVIAGGT